MGTTQKKLILMEKLPDMPHFKRRKCTDTSISDSTAQTATGISPCKQLTMRTACIEQLKKWYSLLEITQQQYNSTSRKDIVSM